MLSLLNLHGLPKELPFLTKLNKKGIIQPDKPNLLTGKTQTVQEKSLTEASISRVKNKKCVLQFVSLIKYLDLLQTRKSVNLKL